MLVSLMMGLLVLCALRKFWIRMLLSLYKVCYVATSRDSSRQTVARSGDCLRIRGSSQQPLPSLLRQYPTLRKLINRPNQWSTAMVRFLSRDLIRSVTDLKIFVLILLLTDNHYHWGCLNCSICKFDFDKGTSCIFKSGRPICGHCEVGWC